MSAPSLTRKQSTLSALIEQERSLSGGESTLRDGSTPETEGHQPVAQTSNIPSSSAMNEAGGDTDIEAGDTDIENNDTDSEETSPVPLLPTLSKKKTLILTEDQVESVSSSRPLRMSSRLMSMKRKGKVVLLRELTQEFEFNAGDILTVRGEEDDFYVCRVLEDVPVMATTFLVAWYNRVSPNLYEVSFDDVCDMKCVITRVSLTEKDGKFSLPQKCIKQTKRLLREALAEERGEEIEEEVEDEQQEEEDDDDEQPPAKRTRSSSDATTPATRRGRKGKQTKAKTPTPKKGKAQKRKAPTPRKEKKEKPQKKKPGRRPGVLIPNPDIELVDVDPTFETRDNVGLMMCKQSIRAVHLNDLDLLKTLIDNVKDVHSVHWPQSPDVGKYAIHYALLNNNKEAFEVLLDDIITPKEKRCKRPNISLTEMDTGSYNFHTFGHAVRQIYASRGSREGNNAFLKDTDKNPFHSSRSLLHNLLNFCLKNEEVSLEMLETLIDKAVAEKKIKSISRVIENIWLAVRSGNRKVAGHFVKMALEKDGFGFNFLHKEVLLNDTQKLSKFRAPSVKKKPYMNKCILPLHAACINPNGQYLKDLLSLVPEYNIPDKDGYKMIHYTCACEGPGPLKVLLSRGVDPNDLAPKGVTPLMIAAKYGRDKNVEALLAISATPESDDEVEENDDTPAPRVCTDVKSKSTKAAIHYAALRGHVSTIKVLVSHGSNINLQTGSNKWNLTPLMIGAMKGNLDLVKTCVDLGGSPDARGKWKMTALMYAVKNGHSTVASYLLRLGVDPNAVDTSGNTPVHYAAAYGWLHCLQLLIKAGANANAVNQWKTTALALSMMKDHIKCTDYLLSLDDCNVNFPDDNGQTLLTQTTRKLLTNKMKERVVYLVNEKGADVKTVDTDGWTPLHHLAANSIYVSGGPIPESEWLGLNKKETDKNTTASQDEDELMDTQEESSQNDDEDDDMDNADDNDDDDGGDGGVDDDGVDADADDDDDDDGNDDDDDDDDESDSDADSNAYGQPYRYSNMYEDRITPPPMLLKKFAKISCEVADILIKAGADVNAVDEQGQTPMMLAIMQYNYPLIRKLISLGAKPNVGKNKQGRQVIHLQAHKQNTCDLREMYPDEKEPELSGTVKEQIKQRKDFLAKLVQKTNTDILKLFIDSGAEISATDNNGLTPLMVACHASHLEMFEVLLDNNADPSLGLEDTGRNLLHFLNTIDRASRGRLASKMAKLMDGPARKKLASTVDNNGFTPLLFACEDYASDHNKTEEREEIWRDYVKVLIEEFGCDVTTRVGKFKKGEKVRRANVNNLGLSGNQKENDEFVCTGKFSCLHFIVNPRSPATDPLTLQLLLKYLHGNSDLINSRDLLGRTPLHYAVVCRNTSCVEELVKCGADVNLFTEEKDEPEENQHFSTALILACKPTLELEIATCLLKGKANPNLLDKQGRSALSHAVTNKPDSDESSLKLARALLEAGADVNSADYKDRSVLHYAVNATTGGFETLLDVEDLLLKNGADTQKKDDIGRLPLHYAFVKKLKMGCDADANSLSDPVSISSLLVDAMEDQSQDIKTVINHADINGQTPLHRAAIRGATLCVMHLVKKGAEINVKDNNDNTPFSLAIRGGHDSCAMSLIQQGASPKCNVITPVTQSQLDDYEKKKEKELWLWKELTKLQVPAPIIKSAFYEVVKQNWQGVAYLMLDVAGLDFIIAMKAVLDAEKLDLAWTLLRKQKKDSSIRAIDENKRNVLHLLALYIDSFNDVVEKIAVHVLQRGVSPSSVDIEGGIPLHYAACNGNKGLCELLLRYNPSTINVADPSGMTPLAGCFDADGNLSSRHKLIESLITCHKPKTLDVCYKVCGDSEESTTPLIEACLSQDEKLLTLLLDNKASVNFPKANGITPLMEVVRANLEDIAKVLLYGTTDRAQWKNNTTKVDLTAVDNDGKTVIHHCVQNRKYGSSENVIMLLLLAKFGAPLEVRDSSGQTPLDYANKQQSGKMKEALIDLIADKDSTENGNETMETDEELGFEFTTTLADFWEGPEPDIEADSEAMLAEAKTDDEEPDWDPSKPPPVDRHASVENGEVYIDPDTGIPYDILMTKVDVKYGMFGLNNFYKMQVVHHKGKDLYVLLNRWGRIGDSGQHQRTPFGSPEEATSEFRKIFRSKTGNKWEDKDNFQKMPKKYALVLPERNPEFKRKKAREILKPFDLEKCPPSKLPKELQKLMEDITNVQFMKEAMNYSRCRIDQNYLPFGRLSTATFNEAREILMKIKNILSGIDRQNMKGSEDKFEQIVDLSNSYYMLIPMAGYSFERIRPLNEVSDVDENLKLLTQLTELAFVSKLLLAAQYRSKDINPLDYCYRVLGVKIELMDPTSDECQLILKYAYNSSGIRSSWDIDAVYRLCRPIEKDRMKSCGVSTNHRLLWHGTRTAHALGILKQGLCIAPPDAVTTGWLFGKGIYFSDTLRKSAMYSDLNYCRQERASFILLSQVALGVPHEYTERLGDEITGPPPNHDSIWHMSDLGPDPTHDVTTPYGAVLSSGPLVKNQPLVEKYKDNRRMYFTGDSEFIVYNEAQVQLRYLVQCRRS